MASSRLPSPGLEQPLGRFLEDVASERPAPGAGSVAAIVAALAAGLAEMSARLSREWPEAATAARRANALRNEVAALAEDDARAYAQVLRALKLPKESVEARASALAQALSEAANPPLAIAELARTIAALAAECAEVGNPNLRGDAAAGAVLAEAAARIGARLAAINLREQPQDERLARAQAAAEQASAAARRALSAR